MIIRSLLITACLLFALLSAQADDAWTTVASLTADGTVKEVNVGRSISKLTITCTSNSVTIASVEVINKENTYSYNVGNKLLKDQTQQVTVGNALSCDKLKITDSGTGKYVIRVRN